MEGIIEFGQINWQTIGTTIVDVIIKAVAFLIILLIGYLVAKIVEGLVAKLLMGWGLDKKLQNLGVKKIVGTSPTRVIAKIFEYYVLLITLENAFFYVNITPLYEFFHTIVLLVPHWVLGAIIILIGFIVAKWADKAIKESRMMFSEFISGIAWLLIMYITVIFALPKFGFTDVSILQDILRIILWGISIGTALAIGIGFGTALQPTAKKILKKLKI
ncbi:hypothetical protein DRN63_02520 [Nanoarchaeota archaeon]|nr:MAG: hypothetical protein DRN63_02520 [Nanoarchaeota archaeon]